MASPTELTIADATHLFEVRRDVLRRLLEEGAVEGARRRDGPNGPEWVLPAASLEALGYKRRSVGLHPAGAWGRLRAPATAIALAVLAVLLGAGIFAFVTDDDDDASAADDPATQILVDRTSANDRVGAVGADALVLIPDRRVPVLVDARTSFEQLPRYVVARSAGSEQVRDAILAGGGVVVLGSGAGPSDFVVIDTAPDGGEVAAPPTTEAPVVGPTAPAEEATTTEAPTTAPTTAEAPTTTQAPTTTAAPVTTTTEAPTTTVVATTATTVAPTTVAPTTTAPPPTTTVAPPPTTEPGSDGELDGEGSPGGVVRPGGVGDERDLAALQDGGAVEVIGGDSFWALAEQIVLEVQPDADVSTVTAFWFDLVEANNDQLVQPGNADLILPGQVLVVPPLS